MYDLILAVRSQIFEYLLKTFCRRALEYPQSARSEKTNEIKAVFLRKRLTIVDFLEACGRWGHVFVNTDGPRS